MRLLYILEQKSIEFDSNIVCYIVLELQEKYLHGLIQHKRWERAKKGWSCYCKKKQYNEIRFVTKIFFALFKSVLELNYKEEGSKID